MSFTERNRKTDLEKFERYFNSELEFYIALSLAEWILINVVSLALQAW